MLQKELSILNPSFNQRSIPSDNNTSFNDIKPLFFGYEKLTESNEAEPCIRDYFTIHFCRSGNGTLRDKYGSHKITPRHIFILRPGEVASYTSDPGDPLECAWISFEGPKADIFDCGVSRFRVPEDLEKRFFDLVENEVISPYIYVSIIYELMYLFFSDKVYQYNTISALKRYIKYNYMSDIKIDSLAREFGFERSYLFRMFKERYGISIKDYITKTRLEKAKSYLASGHSVAETAIIVGYGDSFNFSKAYKKYYGAPPSKDKSRRQTSDVKVNTDEE